MLDTGRQTDIVPAKKLQDCSIDVIGVGAVGRQVALQLASIGAVDLRLVDNDIVDSSNVCTQGYYNSDIGLAKVEALAAQLEFVNLDISCRSVINRWTPKMRLSDNVVFCCVDSITTRSELFDAAINTDFFVDGRMLAEVGYVYPVFNDTSRQAYRETLFDASEAERGRCTAKSTIYCANHVASAMVHQFVRWIRGQKPFACGGTIGLFEKLY